MTRRLGRAWLVRVVVAVLGIRGECSAGAVGVSSVGCLGGDSQRSATQQCDELVGGESCLLNDPMQGATFEVAAMEGDDGEAVAAGMVERLV
jgi:hypothetical protein